MLVRCAENDDTDGTGWLKMTFSTTWRKLARMAQFVSDASGRHVWHGCHASAGEEWRGRPSVEGMHRGLHTAFDHADLKRRFTVRAIFASWIFLSSHSIWLRTPFVCEPSPRCHILTVLSAFVYGVAEKGSSRPNPFNTAVLTFSALAADLIKAEA